MRSAFLAPLVLVLGALAQDNQTEEDTRRCGTKSTGPAVSHAHFSIESREQHAIEPFTIETYIHFVAPRDPPESLKRQLRSLATKQLEALDAAFAPARISFTRNQPLIWTDSRLASLKSTDDLAELIEKYRVGNDVKTLNLFIPQASQGLGFGACVEFDDIFTRKTAPRSWDGCFVKPSSLPGHRTTYSLDTPPSEGKTAVHEVGHWLGLYHTFEGGCDGDGDHIYDTPAQAYETRGCDENQDTCPDQKGKDPIHNYMGYSDDHCVTEFTTAQIITMHNAWRQYRN